MRVKLTLLALLGLGSAVPALADTYSLTIDQCSGGCGTAPFGTIDVTQAGTNTVLVDVKLDSAAFVSTGFPGSFAFDLVGDPKISVSHLTSGWSLLSTSAGSLHFAGLGRLDYTLECGACGHGGSHPFAGPISFDVTAPGLTAAAFKDLSVGGKPDVYFVADLMGSNGRTGPIGATLTSTRASVPEPAPLTLLAAGLVLMALMPRRRRAPSKCCASK